MTTVTDTRPLSLPSCPHTPTCPPATATDHDAAVVICDHHNQGWCLLCNGIIRFADNGEISPTGKVTDSQRPEPPHRIAPETAA